MHGADVVDHIIPHKGDQSLFWDSSNWQPLCKHHHDQKTAREDGGFGRAHAGAQVLKNEAGAGAAACTTQDGMGGSISGGDRR